VFLCVSGVRALSARCACLCVLLYIESWRVSCVWYCTQRVGMESWVVCVFARVFFCGVLDMKCGSMLIFLACCVQHIPSLLMALHHVLVCVHVL
jgi:hypothetical protein